MNNILDHFATAYFDLYLKGDQNKLAYLQPSGPATHDGNGAMRPAGTAAADPGLKGFKPHTAVGLILEHASAAK